jgi:hypothetical protein
VEVGQDRVQNLATREEWIFSIDNNNNTIVSQKTKYLKPPSFYSLAVGGAKLPSELSAQLRQEFMTGIKGIISNRSTSFFTDYFIQFIRRLMPGFKDVEDGLVRSLCRHWAIAGKKRTE